MHDTIRARFLSPLCTHPTLHPFACRWRRQGGAWGANAPRSPNFHENRFFPKTPLYNTRTLWRASLYHKIAYAITCSSCTGIGVGLKQVSIMLVYNMSLIMQLPQCAIRVKHSASRYSSTFRRKAPPAKLSGPNTASARIGPTLSTLA